MPTCKRTGTNYLPKSARQIVACKRTFSRSAFRSALPNAGLSFKGHGVQREPWPGEALVQTGAKGVRV